MRKWDAKAVGRRRHQTLAGYRCPQCRNGELVFSSVTGTNVCDRCSFELITEWEWERRQQEAMGTDATRQTH